MQLNKKILQQIKDHSLSESPNECCGLIIMSNNVYVVVRCENIAKDKTSNFEISPIDYLVASTQGKIIAYYHSHCLDSQPDTLTPLDLLISTENKLPIILYHVPSDSFRVGGELEYSEYIGRKFNFDTSDCLSLVEEFYKNEFNIKLDHVPRDENWFKADPNKIRNEYEKHGFFEVDKEKPRFGDLLVIEYNHSFPSHFMIYLSDDEILHHRAGGYSTIEKYNNTLKDMTSMCLRHNIFK